ncbi:MAG: MSMEG_0565 family glycosyltransferase [Streptosporangiaceae bacterium]
MTVPPTRRPVALVTYSAKPRGGVVHTLALADALHARGHPVHVFALGDPEAGFFRPVRAPYTIFPAPAHLPTLEERVFASIDALEDGLAAEADGYGVLHTQDCIAARAASRIRDRGWPLTVVRTVHHVDDFTSQVLVDCQRQAILEPDVILAVSEHWRTLLDQKYGVNSGVVHNGVDVSRFRSVDQALTARLRRAAGAADRPLLLSVGGIEPRKGSDTLVHALSELKRTRLPSPVLAVLGGQSFQDHRAYRDRVLDKLPGLGLELGHDLVLLGTVPNDEVPGWYAAADALAFPSVKEGFGLAVLEAMSAGLPVVTSDLPVFREYLAHRREALLVPVGDVAALRDALASITHDDELRERLRTAGYATVRRFTWSASAAEHQQLYDELPL